MTRDEIIAKVREAAPALRAEGVAKLAIFGSRARGDAGPHSDLDVLIDIDPAASFRCLTNTAPTVRAKGGRTSLHVGGFTGSEE
jgi:predicted nucleotidyltransferase